MSSPDLFDWRGYPKGTFFKYKEFIEVYAIVNKNYSYSLKRGVNERSYLSSVYDNDIVVLGYVPQDFFK